VCLGVPSSGIESPAAVHGWRPRRECWKGMSMDVSPLFMRWCAVMVDPVSMEWTGVYKAARGLEEVLPGGHLTSVLKRLELETHMPTGQQATLL